MMFARRASTIITHPGQPYRSDIDGLRAVAVVPVVLFHAGYSGLKGGFIGVDIFFVISGFLITSIIYRESRDGRFSLLTFYERRVRRILPAFWVVLAFCIVVASLLQMPDQLRAFSTSVLWTLASLSNVYFFEQLNYFSQGAFSQPLLHTWSLAIEEQYYLLFPLFVLALRKFGWRTNVAVIGLVALASLGLCIWQSTAHPKAAFYLLPARAWELLAGSLIAVYAQGRSRVMSAWLAELVGVAGLLMVGAGYVLISGLNVFPGLWALLPCGGAALVILSGIDHRTVVGKLLSFPPFVWIGLISYSLYLWHWPLIVFSHSYFLKPPEGLEKIVLVGVFFLVAALSYRFVERPFRRPSGKGKQRLVFAGALVAVGLVAAPALVLHETDGLPGRFSPETIKAASTTHFYRFECIRQPGEKAPRPFCETGGVGAPGLLVWGDSHAWATFPAFEQLASDGGPKAVLAAYAGCPPFLGVRAPRERDHHCAAFNDEVLAYLRRHPEIRTVVLTARWGLYATSRFTREGEGEGYPIADASTRRLSEAENAQVMQRGLERTLTALNGRRVIILTDTPENRFDIPAAMAKKDRFGFDADLRPARASFDLRQAAAKRLLAEASIKHGAQTVDVAPQFCGPMYCDVSDGQGSLYADADHLSRNGAHRLVPLLRPALGGVQPLSPPQ